MADLEPWKFCPNCMEMIVGDKCPHCGATEKGETMYRSPIEVLMTDIQHQIAEQQDDQIYQAVVSVGINVDKEELVRALRYDRDQYDKGYADGERDAIAAMIRCEDCKHSRPMGWYTATLKCCHKSHSSSQVPYEVPPDHFCSYGERREGE